MVQYLSALYSLYVPEVKEEFEGQGMVEYGLILVLVSVVVITILTTMGGTLNTVFTTVNTALGG